MNDQLYLPDLGNGLYQNPVIFCDYSDPDVIRVDDTYYLTASSFNYVPGLPILTSKDLVNWTLVNYALAVIPEKRYDVPRHAEGVWAPSIRYHEGMFFICYGMPDEGIFMVRASDPLGRWEEPVCLLRGKGFIDPCPFWDEDGNAYVVHGYARSRCGIKSHLGIFPMSWDGTKALGDDHIIYNGIKTQPTIEGPKVYRRGGYVYLFAPAGGVATGWQTVLRAKDIHGPFEERIVLEQGDTEINGPHQGGWVTTPDGQDWFVHFQSRGSYGRICHLQPMRWTEDGWPVMGDNGKPVIIHEKPHAPQCERTSEQASDDFSGKLGLQWQFMGNWTDDFYTVENGRLRLYACQTAADLWRCPQVLTQKVACAQFDASVNLDVSELKAGEQAGAALIGGQHAYIAVRRIGETLRLVYAQSAGQNAPEEIIEEIAFEKKRLTIHIRLRQIGYAECEASFGYSVNGDEIVPFGPLFAPERHQWVGVRVGLMCMPFEETSGAAGCASFSGFSVKKVEPC